MVLIGQDSEAGSSAQIPCCAKVVESFLGSSLLRVTEQPLTVPKMFYISASGNRKAVALFLAQWHRDIGDCFGTIILSHCHMK